MPGTSRPNGPDQRILTATARPGGGGPVRTGAARLTAGVRRFERADPGEQVCARAAVDGCSPASQVRAWAKERENPTVSSGARLKSAVHAPSASATRDKRRRRRSDTVRMLPTPLRDLLACRPAFRPAEQNLPRRGRLQLRGFTDVDGPQSAANGEEIFGIVNLFMTKELGPGTIRSVAEVVGQFARRIPPTGRLRRTLPQKGKAGIDVTKRDHVAENDVSARASSRT